MTGALEPFRGVGGAGPRPVDAETTSRSRQMTRSPEGRLGRAGALARDCLPRVASRVATAAPEGCTRGRLRDRRTERRLPGGAARRQMGAHVHARAPDDSDGGRHGYVGHGEGSRVEQCAGARAVARAVAMPRPPAVIAARRGAPAGALARVDRRRGGARGRRTLAKAGGAGLGRPCGACGHRLCVGQLRRERLPCRDDEAGRHDYRRRATRRTTRRAEHVARAELRSREREHAVGGGGGARAGCVTPGRSRCTRDTSRVRSSEHPFR
jgi:hypothetical protein